MYDETELGIIVNFVLHVYFIMNVYFIMYV